MKIFIDTADVNEIKEAAKLGIVDGVTTNPSLISKSGRDFNEVIKEIVEIVDGPISGEVKATTEQAENIIKEAKGIASIHKNMVVKIPITKDRLIAVRELSKLDIKTNVTLIFSPTQALLAAKAGATYVSPFLGRLDDISTDGMNLIQKIKCIFDNYNFQTNIIAASIRNPMHVLNCALAGSDICTIPYNVIMQLLNLPLTDIGIEKFKKDYLSTLK